MTSLLASSKRRLLDEMLHSVPVSEGEWRVLIVDDVTVKVFSSACKLSDVTEEDVSRTSRAAAPASAECAGGRVRRPNRWLTAFFPARSGGGPVQASGAYAAHVRQARAGVLRHALSRLTTLCSHLLHLAHRAQRSPAD